MLVGNTRIADPAPTALSRAGTTYVFLASKTDSALHPRVVALSAQADIAWDRTYTAIELSRPNQPRIVWTGDRLRLFWISDDQLFTVEVTRSGDLLDTPALLSSDILAGAYDVARDGQGQWIVWFAGPRREPGLYVLAAGDLTDPQATLVDPEGVRPDLHYDGDTLHAVWAHYPTGYERKELLYASYPQGLYRPGQESIVTDVAMGPSSVLDGPRLGLEDDAAYLFWAVLVRTGPTAGTAEANYVHFPRSQPAKASARQQLRVPSAYNLTYESKPGGALKAGARMPWSNPGGAAFITDLAPTSGSVPEMAVGLQMRIPYLRRKQQEQVGMLYFQDGGVVAYQLLSFTPTVSSRPSVLSDQDGYLTYTWLERGAGMPGYFVYLARTNPDFKAALAGITAEDAQRLAAETVFGLVSNVLLLPLALIWIIAPIILLVATSFVREDDAKLRAPGVLISLAITLGAYWVSKLAILPNMRDYVPFSAWLPFIPGWMEMPLRIGVPAAIAILGLLTAWLSTYRVERRSPFYFLMIYAVVDATLTMGIYGVLILGAF